jgi:hypothetical protein
MRRPNAGARSMPVRIAALPYNQLSDHVSVTIDLDQG